MRQMLFAKVFPANHPRKGEPTYFVEKIWHSLTTIGIERGPIDPGSYIPSFGIRMGSHGKSHTIRAGHRWKAGDSFIPKIWSGKPYRSKTITFAPPLEVKKTWDIEIWPFWDVLINGKHMGEIGGGSELILRLAANDGLSEIDMRHWFSLTEKFEGQIICWNDKIEYL